MRMTWGEHEWQRRMNYDDELSHEDDESEKEKDWDDA